MRSPRVAFSLLALVSLLGGGGCSVASSEPGARAAAPAVGTVKKSAAALSVAPKNTFARAVCVCGDLSNAGLLTTNGAPGFAADVGVMGTIVMSAQTKIDGSVLAGGAVDFAGQVSIANDLVTPRDVHGSGLLTVGHDLSCGGSLVLSGESSIGGTLAVAGEDQHAGARTVGSLGAYAPSTTPPCGCDAFDVAGAVTLARTSNDDAAHGLDPSLSAVGTNTITLETGRYYFEDAQAVGRTHFVARGAVSLYVEGSLEIVGQTQFEVEDGGSLDLYVAGGVGYAGSIVAGNTKDSSAFRLYVGGTNAIITGAGEATYHGFIYAPGASIDLAGSTSVTGAIFAKNLTFSGALSVTYAAPTEREDAPTCAEMPASYPVLR